MISILILSLSMSSVDTGIVKHINDGLVNEWPAARFTEDKESSVHYAIDNDKDNLYIALKLADPFTQIQMMRMGMHTYFDLKGKHKENKGIEFPSKKDFGGSPLKMPPNVKEEKVSNALNLISLKIFGFTDPEPKEQSLEMEGTVNIVFTWDAADVMFIEYSIPLKMLEDDPTSLAQKEMSVGWKIKALDMQDITGSRVTTTSTVVGARQGQRPSANPSSIGQSGAGNRSSPMSNMMKDRQVWAKYSFSF